MIRPTPLFTIVFCFCVALNTTTNARTLGASTMGADHEDGELAPQPAWPTGFHAAVNKKNRIHGYWVNTTDVFFYRGNNGEINDMIESLTSIKAVNTKIILHAGSGLAKSPWGTDKGVANWSVTSYCKAGFGKADSVLIDIWISDGIQLDKLKISADATIADGQEIKSFIEHLKSNSDEQKTLPENGGQQTDEPQSGLRAN